MAVSPKEMPANTDGKAHLFFAGDEPVQLMALSTTGCIAIESPGNPVCVFHWYYRMKGREFITLAPAQWLILYSCRAPWNTEPCGHITRLHVSSCGLGRAVQRWRALAASGVLIRVNRIMDCFLKHFRGHGQAQKFVLVTGGGLLYSRLHAQG